MAEPRSDDAALARAQAELAPVFRITEGQREADAGLPAPRTEEEARRDDAALARAARELEPYFLITDGQCEHLARMSEE